jgi:hypothetical protein
VWPQQIDRLPAWVDECAADIDLRGELGRGQPIEIDLEPSGARELELGPEVSTAVVLPAHAARPVEAAVLGQAGELILQRARVVGRLEVERIHVAIAA